MYSQDPYLFDETFALKQFSGNQPLLIQILDKFADQYADFTTVLSTEIEQNDILDAKHRVHTIKGVSGNLGMNALHKASKTLETQFNEKPTASDLTTFLDIFNQTLTLIIEYKGSVQSQQRSAKTEKGDDKLALIDALKRSEFISEAKLMGYLASIDLPAEVKLKLQQTINDLDYASAITLLE